MITCHFYILCIKNYKREKKQPVIVVYSCNSISEFKLDKITCEFIL